MSIRKLAAGASFLVILFTLGNARAFDYPEHQYISYLALTLAIHADPSAKDAFLDAARALNGSVECVGDDVLAKSPTGCLGLADVPALSGDHAGSPALIKWRWFNDCLQPLELKGAVSNVVGILASLDRGPTPPENVGFDRPDVTAMIDLIRHVGVDNWPLNEPPADTDFLSVDNTYVTARRVSSSKGLRSEECSEGARNRGGFRPYYM